MTPRFRRDTKDGESPVTDDTQQHEHHHDRANGDRLRDYQISELQRDLRNLGEIMREGFDRLEAKIDARLDSRDKRLDEHEGRIRKLEERVQGLEVWRTILGGLLGVLGGLAAATLWGIPFGGQ